MSSQEQWQPTTASQDFNHEFDGKFQKGYNLSKQSGFKSTTVRRNRGSHIRRLLMPCALLTLFIASGRSPLLVNGQDTSLSGNTTSTGAVPSNSQDAGSPAPTQVPSQEDTQDSQQYLRSSEIPKYSLDSIEPFAGPITGDTRVVVRGGPFAQYLQKFPQPKNETCIQCDNSPATDKAGNIQFTLSLRGDFLESSNSKVYTFYTPTRIYAIYPMYGPKDGGTVVEIWGENFINYGENTFCAFGTEASKTEYISSTYMRCTTPRSAVVEKPIPMSITLNNQQNSKDSFDFWYYPEPTISELVPDKGPETGGTRIRLKGSNFNPFQGDSRVSTKNDTFCYFKRLDGKVKATVLKSTEAFCIAPSSFDIHETEVELTLNNQDFTDDFRVFSYYKPPMLFDSSPREGPVVGGTRVILIGANFLDTKKIKCKFGNQIIAGTFISSSEIECISPPSPKAGYVQLSVSTELDQYATPLQFLYYEQPQIASIEPACGPDYGLTQITVKGKSFIDMGHNQALCIFNKTIFTNATVFDEETLVCDSPSLLNDQGFSIMRDQMLWYDLEITVNGGRELSGPSQRFAYYRDPQIYDIQPNSGPISGGTKVKIVGKGLGQQGACNKVTRFSAFEASVLPDSNDTQIYSLSPAASTPDAVVVGITLNGQQFTKDVTIHMRDVENTFEYYQIPIVTSFEPSAGPSIGGTLITIHGIGFTPKKDNSGATDQIKNQMWLRFVDPETKEPLAPSQLVKKEDLSDDLAIFQTPALPADTKALLQMSLNNFDWHNIPLPNKAYSYIYFESPHITKLTPAFGPVKHKELILMDIEGKNFKCSEPTCADLYVRFGEPNVGIRVKGQWISESLIRVKVPRYTKPEVLPVELTLNGKDWTNDHLTYGYFDPFIIRAEPALISIDGTTKIKLIGFGFVNSKSSKSIVRSPQSQQLLCPDKPCISDAVFINQHSMETQISPQAMINYNDSKQNILWDPMTIDASIHGSNLEDFTENGIQVFFYEEPEYKEMSISDSPANIESRIFITTDFKKNPIDRLKRFSSIVCRFKSSDEVGVTIYTNGELSSYPLQKGSNTKPNSVTCKNPKWNLNGRLFETVKLDIALNGQEFRGDKNFTFSQDLNIHRTIPMSGPIQGSTKTSLVGTGLKGFNLPVSFKWGVLSTKSIPKSEVHDYIYQKTQFENWWTGYEGLKAYIYEASNYARVDSLIEDGKTYQLHESSSIAVPSWTETNGGPFYIELGRDQEIKFSSTQKVTITTPATNSTPASTQIVDQDTIQSWIYYDYQSSSVEYYQYKDCIIKDIFPHSGLIVGGTKVTVLGAWFKYMPEYGVVPHCKFGDKIVRAQFDSTVRITCISPSGEQINQNYPFEVSLNGVDWSNSGMQFSYYDEPEIYGIAPTIGPIQGGTEIFFSGKNFFNLTNSEEFKCKFTPINIKLPAKKIPAIYLNSSTVMCPSPGGWDQGIAVKVQVTFNGINFDNNNFTFTFYSITRAFPRSGPSDGTGGDIIIDGFGFRNDTNPLCKLDNDITPPVSVSWTQIRCPMPRSKQGENFFGNVDLAVTPNGFDWLNFVGGFQYYPQPVVEEIYPKQGPNQGLGIINFYGKNFRKDYPLEDIVCKIGDSIGIAQYIPEKDYIKCVVEDIHLVNKGEFLAAQLALNRYSWTSEAADPSKTHYTPYGIERIFPNSGPVKGETVVIIQGKGFEVVDQEDGVSPRCRFGTAGNYAVVDAVIICKQFENQQILAYDRIQCRAPSEYVPTGLGTYPIDVPLSVAIAKDENDPWTESSHKFRFYQQPIISKCDPCEVDVGAIREVYVWAEEGSQFFEPVMAMTLSQTEQDAEDSEIIEIPSEFSGIKCSFGRFGQTLGTYVNESVIICVTPSVNDEPDSIYKETVQLTVSMNGVSFEEEISDVRFTFIGTGTYIAFWPFIIGAVLIAVLAMALIQCCNYVPEWMSLRASVMSQPNNPGSEHVVRTINGVIPKAVLRDTTSRQMYQS